MTTARPGNARMQPLLVAAIGLVALPFAMRAIGLTLDTAIVVVVLCMATMGLNLLVGYTGLVSFGHSAWFGIGGYAAAIAQLHWFPGQFVAPLLFSVAFTATLALVVGFLILRRRGVYFSLLTLALCALTFAIAFRWTSLTGGEGGLGGIERGRLGPIDLDNDAAYYVLVALVGFAVTYGLLRVVRSPFGHVLVAIRENEQRATFQGYDTDRYKLGAFVLSTAVTGLAGALLVFDHRFAAAESTTVAFSGELLAMVVIGGMRSFLGPGAGRPVLHPVPRVLLDLDRQLAAVVRADLRRLRPVLADRADRHLGQAASGAGGRRPRRARR